MNTINPASMASAKLVLRQLAEKLVSGEARLSEETLAALPPAMVLKMLHDLQVHEIELEMQNETLRQTQLQLVAMQARYFDLYDLAPISYCTVNETGLILEANMAASEMLGEVRSKLVGQRISSYISKEIQDIYYLSCKLLLAHGKRQDCELRFIRPDGVAVWAQVNITIAKDSNGDTVQYMSLTDITNAKLITLALHAREQKLRDLTSRIS
jgi:PAS domain S-box-containing protein